MMLLVSPSKLAPNYPIIKKKKKTQKFTDLPCGKGIVWFTVYVMTRERVTGAIVCGRTLAYRVGPLKTKRVINHWKKAY